MRNPFVPAPQYEGYTGYAAQKKRPQTVEEILSGEAVQPIPDLSGAQTSARSQRSIADLLTNRAMGRQATGIVDGLSQLGEAWLANKAIRKADASEKQYGDMVRLLTEKAAGGDEASIAQLLSPEAMIGRKDQKARQAVEDAFRDKAFDRGVLESDRGFGLQKDQFDWQVGIDERNFNRGVEEFDQTFGLNQAQFEEGKRQFNARQASDAAGASDYGLNIVWGRDEAGNYVPMQASKRLGLAAAPLPEGVTLLGPQGTAFDTAMGKEEAKKAAYQTQAGQALQAALSKGDEVLAQIDKAVDQTRWWNTGLIGQMVFAGNLDATLDALGAKAMLSELVAIKAQGGTLGALSDAEGKALRDAAVAVSRSQDEKQLDANLKAYRLQVEKSMQRLQSAFEAEYVGQSYGRAPPVRSAAPQAPADLSGASDDDLFSILGGR